MAEVSENAGGFVLDVFARDPQSEGRGAPVVLELKLATAKEIVEAMTRAIEYEEEQWVRKENRDFRDLLAGIINHYEVEGHKTIFAEFGSPNVYV
jgi:hypothetical protein